MTLLQLQYFEVLSQTLHYTRAAEKLYISQPTLSHSIGELEKELGVKLFQREHKKITLTIYGKQFLFYVKRALSLLHEGTSILEQLASTSPEVVKLGYVHSISDTVISNLVENLYRIDRNQKIRFQFTEGSSSDIFIQLKKGLLDIAFSTQRDDWAKSVAIIQQPLYLAVPKKHPLAKQPFVYFEDFAQEQHITLDKSSGLYKQIRHIFAQRDAVMQVLFEVQECSTALQYVALGFGVSILPWESTADTEKVSMLPISDKQSDFVRTIYASWSRSRSMSASAETVRNFIVERYSFVN